MSAYKAEPIKTSGKRKRELDEKVALINSFYERYSRNIKVNNPNDVAERKYASEFLVRQTNTLRNEIKTYMNLGYTEEDALARVMPKAYATVKVASDFLWKKPHYDAQLIGGILLNEGYASEMATGEGKTLTAALPAYLNALLGKGAHVITPNGYLAKRDFEEMSELYELLGLSCGLAEERGKLSEEDITAKVIEILDAKLDKYSETARNETERQQMIFEYLRDKKNAPEVAHARKLAQVALTKEGDLRRKNAYQADITYGSASAIAFDYLFDDIATDPKDMVHRQGNPNFVVIDEMDAVLFDDATTPDPERLYVIKDKGWYVDKTAENAITKIVTPSSMGGYTYHGYYTDKNVIASNVFLDSCSGTQIIDPTTNVIASAYLRTDGSVGTKGDEKTTIYKDMKIYPCFKPIKYTINYSCNGGTGTVKSTNHVYNTPAKLAAGTNCKKTGYTFS